jgi:hypothetical protein
MTFGTPKNLSNCLASNSYLTSQDLAQQSLDIASLGVIYPSLAKLVSVAKRLFLCRGMPFPQ